MPADSSQHLSTDRFAKVEFMMHVAGRDAFQKILQPIDAAEMRPYDKCALPHFDIDRVFFSKTCLLSHALRYPDGQAVSPFLSSGFHLRPSTSAR
jgi:hypothetical protein